MAVSKFISELLSPIVDARIFEIVSYAILRYYYRNQVVYFGFDPDDIRKENLMLFKTGRTNANDGGIDFVMRPLGRFFQVTETLEVKKYFLDIDVKVNDDIGRRYTFNTAIAAMMELLNALQRAEKTPQTVAIMQEGLEAIVLMLSPIVPHLTQTLWESLGHEGLVIDVAFPHADTAALVKDEIELVVQVNGKLRGKITVAVNTENQVIEQLALTEENVQKHLDGKTVKKVVIVPKKLVNIVVA
ncbi:MAG: class I tRNA ligase family protein [Thiotrichaceae bacterium]